MWARRAFFIAFGSVSHAILLRCGLCPSRHRVTHGDQSHPILHIRETQMVEGGTDADRASADYTYKGSCDIAVSS